MSNQLGNIGLRLLEDRGISAETAVRYGVYTGARAQNDNGDTIVAPDPNGTIVVFPFVDHGRVVAEKYRAPGKQFWQKLIEKRRTFWNADVLDDPALRDGHQALTITEGELDALTAIDCGFPFAVSVPDGAPAVREGEDPAELPPADPEQERSGKFEFVWNNRDRLKQIRRFIIAVDNDRPGKRLEAELLRRLSPARCLFVAYPDGCKDLNDVRRKHGAEGVARCLNDAKPYPVKGLYRLSQYRDQDEPETYSTGLPGMDDYLKLWLGELLVITGIPGMGKSSLIISLCVNLAARYGWSIAMASFEIPTVPSLRHKLRLVRGGSPKSQWTRGFVDEIDAWLEEHFVFIDDDPSGESDEAMTLEWLLERAEEAVMRDGVKVLVIDPWNEVEHARPKSESEAEYTNRALRSIRRFASRHQVIAIIVAHPTKDVGKEGGVRVPSLYDISGSAAFFNKPDHGIVVHVPNADANQTIVYVKKARFGWSGKRGKALLAYDPETETYGAPKELSVGPEIPF